jgi:aldose 1-epimerase
LNDLDLATPNARVRLAPHVGGAIASFTFREQPVLRETPPAALAAGDVRATACYPLVPYSNRIRDARLRHDGRTFVLARNFGSHPHAIHGVGWQRAWSVIEASTRHAQVALAHDANGDDAAAWPWPFRATQTFRLSEDANEPRAVRLVVTLTLANTGREPFPFGLGWHPFFVRDAATRIAFRARQVWHNDATQLPQRLAAIPRTWRFDRPRETGDVALDNVFVGWSGTASIHQPATATVTTLDADSACSRLVFYAPAHAPFVALEPVTHDTDAFNRAVDGAANTGMRILPPGAAFSCTMRVAVAANPGFASPATPR